jgi:transcriptional regulator with XRE-family HTH domain
MSISQSILATRERGQWLAHKLGREIRAARRSRGMSQRDVAALAKTSQPTISRLEHGSAETTIGTLAAAGAAIGLDLSLRLFPTDRSPLRDRGQARMIETILQRSSTLWHPATEVAVAADPSDRRAIDLVLASALEVLAIEVQREFADLQSETRQHLAKRDVLQMHERRPVRYVLALPDTHRMHQLVRDHAVLMQTLFPMSSRKAWRAIRSGEPLGGDALLWVPSTKSTGTADGISAVDSA